MAGAEVGGPRGPQSLRRSSGKSSGKTWVWVLVLVALAAGGAAWWRKTHNADASGGVFGSASAASGGASGTFGGSGAGGPGGPGGPGGAAGRRFGGANRVQPVSVRAVRTQDIRVTLNAIGSIAASNTAVVHAQVSGVLQSLNFTEGQQVRAGQLLAQIDPRAFQATLAGAEGTLARDKALLDNARIDLTRYRDLVAKDAAPKQQQDTQASLVRQLEGTVKGDQAAVDSARLQLSYTKVTAPISGRVGLKQVDLGNIVQTSDANGIVSVSQTRPSALVFAIPSAYVTQIVTRLKAGEPLAVEAWDRGGTTRLAVGKLATLDNAIDASTDTIKLKALFPNADGTLFPNQSVSVRLQLSTQSDVLAVPQAAVQRGAQGFFVYIVNPDSSVAARVVKPGAVDGEWMAVEGAVQAGDRVVIDGVDRLRDGAKVEVIAADPRQRAGASAPAGGGRRGGRGASGASGAGFGGGFDRAASGAPARSGSAVSGATEAATGERPRWMDRVPPEVAEKLMKMSPDERRAYFQKRREEGASAAFAASAPR